MWATKRPPQRGATVAEFALTVVMFLGALFFVIEAMRVLYLWNTLQEATRRAAYLAAVSDFSNPAVMDAIRQSAVLRGGAGHLPLGAPVSDAHIRIDYLSLTRSADGGSLAMTPIPAANMPACPARAHFNCVANPYGPSCIRFVRARLCAPGTDCDAVNYQPIFPLTGIHHALSQATTIAKAESLGYQPGSPLCP